MKKENILKIKKEDKKILLEALKEQNKKNFEYLEKNLNDKNIINKIYNTNILINTLESMDN